MDLTEKVEKVPAAAGQLKVAFSSMLGILLKVVRSVLVNEKAYAKCWRETGNPRSLVGCVGTLASSSGALAGWGCHVRRAERA